ncbi:hypothetical protein KQX54_015811 [Cotesia glomerata]|uniref:Uncharacterized protein n=1 Tax=Cotesia glomerata TaxID=32391 RepID=A0AAV7IFQ6_COTGL|nr:hypothetical protein KQX54_015811 [Cotesia glomerata]
MRKNDRDRKNEGGGERARDAYFLLYDTGTGYWQNVNFLRGLKDTSVMCIYACVLSGRWRRWIHNRGTGYLRPRPAYPYPLTSSSPLFHYIQMEEVKRYNICFWSVPRARSKTHGRPRELENAYVIKLPTTRDICRMPVGNSASSRYFSLSLASTPHTVRQESDDGRWAKAETIYDSLTCSELLFGRGAKRYADFPLPPIQGQSPLYLS